MPSQCHLDLERRWYNILLLVLLPRKSWIFNTFFETAWTSMAGVLWGLTLQQGFFVHKVLHLLFWKEKQNCVCVSMSNFSSFLLQMLVLVRASCTLRALVKPWLRSNNCIFFHKHLLKNRRVVEKMLENVISNCVARLALDLQILERRDVYKAYMAQSSQCFM